MLHADESGMALIYVTLMLPVIVGFSLLAIDASRVYILQSSLQNGADAIALAMAAELNRAEDSIIRAERARDNLVANPALFTDTFSVVDESTIRVRYLRSLPSSDEQPISAANLTDPPVPQLAKYVEVTVDLAQYNTVFPAAFINAVSSLQTSATAIAGFEAGACNLVPMFICNPLEPEGNTNVFRTAELINHVTTPSLKRRLCELKAFPNSGQAQYSPGNFGYLDTQLGGGGARVLKDAISEAVPGTCLELSQLSTQTGNIASANDAFNTRFDMYGGSFNRSDQDIRPARNTRKSWRPAANGNNRACRPTEITDLYTNPAYRSNPAVLGGMGFPRDSCQVTNTCGTGAGGRIGSGDWNDMFNMYMNANFPGGPRPTRTDGSAFTSADLPSRYEVYRAEIDQGRVGSRGMATPACYNNQSVLPNDQPDRRIFFAAIANCRAQAIGSGGGSPVTAAAIGQFFLTEPVGTTGSVYAELVGIRRQGAGGSSNGVIITDNVQLRR